MLELMTQPEGGPPAPRDAYRRRRRALNLAGCELCTQLLTPASTPLESAAMHSSTEAADVYTSSSAHAVVGGGRGRWRRFGAGLPPTGRCRSRSVPSQLGRRGAARGHAADRRSGRDRGRGLRVRGAQQSTRRCRLSPRRGGRTSTHGHTGARPRCTSPSSSSGPRWSGTCSIGVPRSPSKTPATAPTPSAGPRRATTAARQRPQSERCSERPERAEASTGTVRRLRRAGRDPRVPRRGGAGPPL